MILSKDNRAVAFARKCENGYIYYGHDDGHRYYRYYYRRYYPTPAIAIKLFCPEELLPEMIKYDSNHV